jgi:two-component system chemotaxis response regulator CheB
VVAEQVRVLIVDDSALVRRVLRAILERDPEICVVGEAANGREALDCVAELRPNVITMDVRMPVMDGLETTTQLMAYYPTPILVITASLSRYDIDITFQMLGAGALDVIEKPRLSAQGQSPPEFSNQELIRRVKAISRMKVVTHLRGRRRIESGGTGYRTDNQQSVSSSAPVPTAKSSWPLEPVASARLVPRAVTDDIDMAAAQPQQHPGNQAPFPLVVIGASAGGPRVVRQILMGLPRSFRAAVVVVQHIAEGFGAGMAEWLSDNSALPVRLAAESMPLASGTVTVAPDSLDLVIRPDATLHLDTTALAEQRPRPSVDVAMGSAAAVFGSSAIGILLTGMGNDGAKGMQQLRRVGGYTYAQDEATAPIYGMPRAAAELGAVDVVMSPDGIVVALQRRVAAMYNLTDSTDL